MRYATPAAKRCQRDLKGRGRRRTKRSGCLQIASPHVVSPQKVRYKHGVLVRVSASLVLLFLVSLSALDQLQAASAETSITASQHIAAQINLESSDDIPVYHWRTAYVPSAASLVAIDGEALSPELPALSPIPFDGCERYLLQRAMLL